MRQEDRMIHLGMEECGSIVLVEILEQIALGICDASRDGSPQINH